MKIILPNTLFNPEKHANIIGHVQDEGNGIGLIIGAILCLIGFSICVTMFLRAIK